MDTAPAANTGAPDRNPAGERPEIGVPSIVARADLNPKPAPVPSIPLPAESAFAAEPDPEASTAPAEPPVSAVPIDPAAPAESAPARSAPTESAPTDPAPARSALASPAEPTPSVAPPRLVALPSPATDPHGASEPSSRTGGLAVAVAGTPSIGGALPVDDDEDTFTPAVQAKLKCYVYLLVDPRTGRPFHAGLGRGDRCFEHVRAARGIGGRPGRDTRPVDAGAGEPPEYPALDRIRQIEASGRSVRIEILRYGLDPDQAQLVEAVAHDLLGLPGSPAGESQRRPAGEVRLLLTKRAKFKRSHQAVLLRVGPPGTDTSYGQVRHGWRIGRRWVDVDAPRSPDWVVVVVGELVDSVYRLDRWEALGPAGVGSAPGTLAPGEPGRTAETERAADRYSFVGTRDPELERRYVGKSVTPYFGKGGQSSVAYVWCGPHWVNSAH